MFLSPINKQARIFTEQLKIKVTVDFDDSENIDFMGVHVLHRELHKRETQQQRYKSWQ